uniref:Uncharacterized protein n=1 Tax=Marseillevirus sp. TaxID=2809551 RepID=A0AA96EM39_9VIRU|nr:hypothetical protein MarFTMF_444 [Marseillevirus sp.]
MQEFLEKRETVSWFLNGPESAPQKEKFEKELIVHEESFGASCVFVWKVLPNGEKTRCFSTFEDSNFIRTESYKCKNGLPHGRLLEHTTIKKTGKTYLSGEAEFVDGKLHGELWSWNSSGILWKRDTFSEGKYTGGSHPLSELLASRGKGKVHTLQRALCLQFVGRKGEEYSITKRTGTLKSETVVFRSFGEHALFYPIRTQLSLKDHQITSETYEGVKGYFLNKGDNDRHGVNIIIAHRGYS